MRDDIDAVRQAVLTMVAPLVQGRVVVLAGSAAGNAKLEGFFATAGASHVVSMARPGEAAAAVDEQFAAMDEFLAAPSRSVRHAFDALDPTGTAVVYAGSFTAQASFCDRAVIGARDPRHFWAERKDAQHALVRDEAPLLLDLAHPEHAARVLRAEAGHVAYVLQGAPDDRLAMGSSHTLLAAQADGEPPEVAGLLHALARDCRQATAARFDPGTPCTYYGFVTASWAVDFGPFEALVFWNRRTRRVRAPGIIRPMLLGKEQDRAARAAVHTAARRLHARTGYTGAFGIDGVLQPGRYVIHEINPRVCAGFSLLDEMCPDQVPLAAIDLALRTCPQQAGTVVERRLRRLGVSLGKQQRPLVRLWEPCLRPVQERLRAHAATCPDPDGWKGSVRDVLAGSDELPLAALSFDRGER